MVTDWQKIGGYWYYFLPGDSGRMVTGWQNIGGYWYYFLPGDSGRMVTGWQNIGGQWYYFLPGDSGRMVTGTRLIDDKWCYFYSSGVFYEMRLRVTRSQQEKSNWCWAACAQMAGRHITGVEKYQSEIVSGVIGFPFNVTANWDMMKSAIHYASNYIIYVSDIDINEFVFSDAVAETDANQVYIMYIRWNASSGHYVVGPGYNLEKSSIRIIDPWENTATEFYKFFLLKSGTTIGTGYGTWTRAFIY